jgi:regulator of protease activity HflC (stomatin/prohibitin superfamily)
MRRDMSRDGANVAQSMLGRFGCAGVAIGGFVILAAVYLVASINVVPPGHVGVVIQMGQVQPNTLPPGVYFRPFLVQNVIDFETRVRTHNFNAIDAASREYQSVKLTGTLNFSIDAQRADDLYQQVGLDFSGRVIDAAFSDTIKEIVPRFSVTEILGKREEIRGLTKEKIGTSLDRYGIRVEDIYLTDISFSPEYTQAIEQKQVAQQLVEREREILNQKKIQAEQSEIQAKGEALAEVARAQGAAEANKLLTQSITPELIEYQRVQRWDGRMPLYQGNANVMLPVPAASPTPR